MQARRMYLENMLEGSLFWKILTAKRFNEFLHTHPRLLEDAGKCARLDLGMRRDHAAGLATLHHHMTAALADLLETESTESLAAFLSANNRQLGHGKARNK